MDEQLMNQIIELVKQGGNAAIIIIIIHYIVGLLKLIIGLVGTGVLIKIGSKALRYVLTTTIEVDKYTQSRRTNDDNG